VYRNWLILAFAILFCCSVDKQFAGGSSETETGAISGRVVDRDSVAVSNAQVTLNSVAAFDSLNPTNYFLAGWNTISDFNGRFSFVSLTTGRYAVAANYHDSLGGMVHADVVAGETTQVIIRLLPMGIIRGAIDSTIVRLAPRGLFVMVLDLPKRVMVDRTGVFELKPLPEGDYTIRFMSGDSVFADVAVTVRSGEVTTLSNFGTVAPPAFQSADSCVVRTILDTNGLIGTTVRQVAIANGDGRITALDLTSLGLRILPDILGRLLELKSLKIGGNRLTRLPDSLANLTNLEILEVGQVAGAQPTSLGAVPACIGSLKKLKQLDLRGQLLSAIPGWIGGLPALQYLDVSYNGLSALPDSLGFCDSMQDLRIESNLFAVLPAVIGNLKHLKTLWAGSNSIASIPPELSGCAELTWLYLNNNSILSIPAAVFVLPALSGLDINSNRLQSLPDSGWKGCSIKTLDISYNNLTSLPADIITLAPTALFLSGNALCGLPDSVAHWADCYDREWRANQTCPLPQWTLQFSDGFDRPDGALGNSWQTIAPSLPQPAIFQGLVKSVNLDTMELVRFTNGINLSSRTRISIDLKWPSTDSLFCGFLLSDSAGNERYRLIVRNISADLSNPKLALCFTEITTGAIVNYQQITFDSTLAQGRVFGDHTLTMIMDGTTITGIIAFQFVMLGKIELPLQLFTAKAGLILRGSLQRPQFADNFKVEVLQ